MRFEVAQMLRLNLAPLRCRSLCSSTGARSCGDLLAIALLAFLVLPLVIPGHVYDSEALGALASLPIPPLLVVCTWSCLYKVTYLMLRR